jgi:hypothetical protein
VANVKIEGKFIDCWLLRAPPYYFTCLFDDKHINLVYVLCIEMDAGKMYKISSDKNIMHSDDVCCKHVIIKFLKSHSEAFYMMHIIFSFSLFCAVAFELWRTEIS